MCIPNPVTMGSELRNVSVELFQSSCYHFSLPKFTVSSSKANKTASRRNSPECMYFQPTTMGTVRENGFTEPVNSAIAVV